MPQQNSPRYLIDENLAQALLDYLSTRPYGDVFKLIYALQHAPEYNPAAAEEEDNTTLEE